MVYVLIKSYCNNSFKEESITQTQLHFSRRLKAKDLLCSKGQSASTRYSLITCYKQWARKA